MRLGDAVDAGDRAAIASVLDRSMVVEAAAGTGKTTALTNRIVAVLASGAATVDGLVAVTFTEKAAGELKLRLRGALEEARQDAAGGGAERRRLEDALARLEEARVSTIHGFCAELLRERPVAARVDPRFVTLSEGESRRLYAQAFRRFMEEALDAPPVGIRRALRRRDRGGGDPVERLFRAGWTLVDWRDFPAPWRRDPFHREAEIDGLVSRLHDLAQRSAACEHVTGDNLYKDTAPLRNVSAQVRAAEGVRSRDHDGLESTLVELARVGKLKRVAKGRGPYAPGVSREELHAQVVVFGEDLHAFARAADADLAALLKDELREPVVLYEAAKERLGRLDYLDLLLKTRDLLVGDASVRADFARRFTHLFVDEFQDTDPLQAEILILLSSDDPSVTDWRRVAPAAGKLFIVADPKQSIYRFRRADVGIYRDVKELVGACGALSLSLSTSFRATPALQKAVNRAFRLVMTGSAETLQADYVALSPFRADTRGHPSVVALPLSLPPAERSEVVDERQARVVAAFVDWLVKKSGWTVTEREGPNTAVPVAARHVCLLFRRFESFGRDVTRDYVEALEARGIPHLLVGGKSYHAREEVEALRTVLAAIEWPEDELSVFAALKGPLFSVGDEELLVYRHLFGRLHPFRVPAEGVPESLEQVTGVLRLLRSLAAERNRRPVAETIDRLLSATRATSGFVLVPSGEQALANVRHLAELARAYEASGGISFRGFVERLREDADAGEAPEAPILEEGSDGVRLMTVHKAKGLEFPVVILCDINARLAREASRALDPRAGLAAVSLAGWTPAEVLDRQAEETARDEAEGVRVAYVAATRARDILVVPVHPDGPNPRRWLAPLDSILHITEVGSEDVVTFDAEKLDLDVAAPTGIRWEELLGKDGDIGDEAIAREDLGALDDWSRSREEVLARCSRPGLVLRAATEQAARAAAGSGQTALFEELEKRPEPSDADAPVTIVELPVQPGRPAGPRFGTLVHAVLAEAPLDGNEGGVAAAAKVQGRVLGATDGEVAAAAAIAKAALEHDLLRRAASAQRRGACRREAPITLVEADGALVEGVVDLAFEEDGAWTVVDFKTDRELSSSLAVYRRQVGLYARAIAEATGLPAKPVLMRL